jgi:hypothetical protein
VQPKYTVSKGVQASSADGRTVTYQFSTCSADKVPNVDLDASRLLDTLPPGAVVDTGRSPGWTKDPSGTNTWGYDIGEFRSGNGQAGCRIPGVLVVTFPEADFPTGTTANNSVVLKGDPLGPAAERDLATANAVSPVFGEPSTGLHVHAAKSWNPKITSGDAASISLHAVNEAAPATSLVLTEPGAGTTPGLYNWLAPQSIELSPWNPTSITLTLDYRLNGDPAWHTFTPDTPLNGSSNRRVTFAVGASDPADTVIGIPAGRWLDGLRFTWNGNIPTGWSPGNSTQFVAQVLAQGHDGRTAPNPLHNCVDLVGRGSGGSRS